MGQLASPAGAGDGRPRRPCPDMANLHGAGDCGEGRGRDSGAMAANQPSGVPGAFLASVALTN